MRIIKLSLYVGCFFVILNGLAPVIQSKDVQWDSKLVTQEVKFEGKRSNWPQGTLAFLKDEEVSIGLCNDSLNLYVLLAFKSEQYVRMIRFKGITLWFDTKGKNKKEFMLRFISGPTNEEIRAIKANNPGLLERELPPDIQAKMNELTRDTVSTLICYQKDRIVEKPLPLDGSEGPYAKFGIDQGFFVYEFKVPLKESSVRDYGIGAKPDQNISIGMIWGDFERERMSPKLQLGGPQQSGGGINPREGMPGDRGQGDRGPRSEGFRNKQRALKQEVWLKTKLGVSGN
jgi:hypothetical protein